MAKAAWSWNTYKKEQAKQKPIVVESLEGGSDNGSGDESQSPKKVVRQSPEIQSSEPSAASVSVLKGSTSAKRGKRQSGGWRDDLPDPRIIDASVGQRIREFRILRGLTQQGLAKAIGLTFQQVQKYERGGNRIGAGRLVQIAQVLDLPVSALFDVESCSSKNATQALSRKAIAVACLVDRVDGNVAEAALALLKASAQSMGDTAK
ncbi:MAG: helix-turn-helix domain-containing protein [Alphaproteobacteria bacterium]|nr:helix-turn-helix domain-containing protein [Alphaproteobacteria bacterium]